MAWAEGLPPASPVARALAAAEEELRAKLDALQARDSARETEMDGLRDLVSLACLWASTAIREAVQGGAAPTTGAEAWERYGGLPYAWSVPAQRPEGAAWARFDEVFSRRARVGMEMIPALRAALAARLSEASAAVAQIRQEIAALPTRRPVADWTASECMYPHLRGVVEVDSAGWWLTLPGQEATPLPGSLVADRVEALLLHGWIGR